MYICTGYLWCVLCSVVQEVSRQAGGGGGPMLPRIFMTSYPHIINSQKEEPGRGEGGYYTDLHTQHASEEEVEVVARVFFI